jgi:pyruvate formate lyase activating enzyme
LSKIRTRQAFLEGVVFSGGEPLAQVELKRAIEDVKRLGFRVGLHTGGAYPERLKELVAGTKETDLPLVDWVGLDVKTGFSNYDLLTGVSGSADAVVKSLDILLESRVDLECRTTVHPAFVQPEHIFEIAEFLSQRGVRVYKLQRCYDTNRAPMPSPCFEAEFLKSIQRIYPDVAERLF